MVTSKDRLARFLGALMIAGSLIGVLLSLAATVLLVLLGEASSPWPLSAAGWWSGGYAGLKFLAGLGILLLGATPVVMLAALLVRVLRERRWGTVLAVSGLFLVLLLGVFEILG